MDEDEHEHYAEGAAEAVGVCETPCERGQDEEEGKEVGK